MLNLVCLEPKCIQESIICGICFDESHRNHKIRPLKLIINNSQKYLTGLTPLSLDVEKIRATIKETKTKVLTSYEEFETFVQREMKDIKTSLEALFIKIEEQIELKAGSTDELLSALEEIKTKEIEYGKFVALMQKLLAGVPLDVEVEEAEMSGSEV